MKSFNTIFLLIFFITVPALLYAGRSQSISYPSLADHEISFGPSIAYVYNSNSDSGYSINFDTSYSLFIFSASVNLKYINLENEDLWGCQFEFTIWLFCNVGGGFGFLYGHEREFVRHFFIGIPIPVLYWGNYNERILGGAFIEPYYRLNYFSNEIFHEFGVMFKFTTYDLKP